MINEEKQTQFKQILIEWQQQSPTISGTAIVDTSGTLITSNLPDSIDKETMGVIVSSSLSVGQQSVKDLGSKQLRQMVIRNKQGFLVLRNISEKAILLAIVDQKEEPGNILLKAQEISAQIGNLLE